MSEGRKEELQEMKAQMKAILGMISLVEIAELEIEELEQEQKEQVPREVEKQLRPRAQDSQDQPPRTGQAYQDDEVLDYLYLAKDHMCNAKPNDRTGLDRCYQIALTDLEKVIAYFAHYVAGDG